MLRISKHFFPLILYKGTTIKSFEMLCSILELNKNKQKTEGTDPTDHEAIIKKLNELESSINYFEQYKQNYQSISYSSNQIFRNYEGLFFSAKKLKKINIIKLIEEGDKAQVF